MNKKWINYWKKNLSDSMRMDIGIDKSPHFLMNDFDMEKNSIPDIDKVNQLIDAAEVRINNKQHITKKDSEKWIHIDEVKVLICPIILSPTPEHAVLIRNKETHHPFWYYATINRQGQLSIPDETFPVIERKYLKPIADDRIDFFFGSVDDVDSAIASKKERKHCFI